MEPSYVKSFRQIAKGEKERDKLGQKLSLCCLKSSESKGAHAMVGRARPSLEHPEDENGGDGSIMGQALALWLCELKFQIF